MNTWEFLDGDRGQCARQWELLNQITTGVVTHLPPNAIVALVNGIAKTYLYNPAQSPALLVDLLEMPSTKSRLDLRHAIAVTLTVAAFANHDYPRGGGNNSIQDTCLMRAKKVYDELAARDENMWPTEDLLSFGLFGMLAKPIQHNGQELGATQIASVVSLSTSRFATINDNTIPTLPVDFGDHQHAVHIVLDWLESTSQEPDYTSVSPLVTMQYLDALLCPTLCRRLGDSLILPLVQHFSRTGSLELKKLCLRGIHYSLGPLIWHTDTAPSHLAETDFLPELLKLTTSITGDIIPYAMHFLWVTVGILIDHVAGSEDPEYQHPAVTYLLRSLRNMFTVDSADTGFRQNIGVMGFMDSWVMRLEDMCQNAPQDVLDSEVLKEMISFYKGDNNSITPRTTELPSPFDNTWTWLRILQHLEGSCTAMVRSPIKGSGWDGHADKLKEGHNECEESKRDGGIKKGLYWAM